MKNFRTAFNALWPSKMLHVAKIIKMKTWLIVVLIFFTACSYRFAGEGRLPGDIRTVYVDVLDNRTEETGAENIFTADLRYEFVRNDLTAKREAAEGILSGIIQAMRVETISRAGQNVSLERRVTAFLDLKLHNREGKLIWSVNRISASEAYDVTAQDKTAIDFNKRAAINQLSKKLAELIYYRMLDDF